MVATQQSSTTSRRGQSDRQWRVRIQFYMYYWPIPATVAEYCAAIDGDIELPPQPAATGYPNTVIAQIIVDANTPLQAVTAALRRMRKIPEKPIGILGAHILNSDLDRAAMQATQPVH